MLYKTAPARIETKSEVGDEGIFEAYVSVFGNVDLDGDRVVKGAFADSLKSWSDSGDPIPVVWNHQSGDPDMNVGEVLDAEEREEGLWIRGRLDLDASKAAQVWRLLSKRRVREFSFAYDVLDSEQKDGANELRKLHIHECGPTPLGANPDTRLLVTKAAKAEVPDDEIENVREAATAVAKAVGALLEALPKPEGDDTAEDEGEGGEGEGGGRRPPPPPPPKSDATKALGVLVADARADMARLLGT